MYLKYSDTFSDGANFLQIHKNIFAIAAADNGAFGRENGVISRRCLAAAAELCAGKDDICPDEANLSPFAEGGRFEFSIFRLRGCLLNVRADVGATRCNFSCSRHLADSGSWPSFTVLVVGADSKGNHSSGILKNKMFVKKCDKKFFDVKIKISFYF